MKVLGRRPSAVIIGTAVKTSHRTEETVQSEDSSCDLDQGPAHVFMPFYEKF